MRKTRTAFLVTLALLTAVTMGQLLHAAASTPSVLAGVRTESIREPSTWVDARVLAQDTAETITVPTFSGVSANQYRLVLVFSANCADYYVSATGTATVPSSDVTDGTAAERNPAYFKVSSGNTLSIIAPTACKVTTAYYLSRN